jgi:hypothetical protein
MSLRTGRGEDDVVSQVHRPVRELVVRLLIAVVTSSARVRYDETPTLVSVPGSFFTSNSISMSARNSGEERPQRAQPVFRSFALKFLESGAKCVPARLQRKQRLVRGERRGGVLYLCSERLMRATRDVSVVLKRKRIEL